MPKFYYDVVVRFFQPKNSKGVIKSLSDCNVQFYSNDPNFVFTFAHAFKKNGLFISDLDSKMSSIALKEKASEKNPRDEIGYVKSLYFLYLAMKSFGLFSKSKWVNASPYSKKIWASVVSHADDKIRDRQELGNAISKKEKRIQTEKTTKSQRQTPPHSGIIKYNGSPNEKNFGHFKKTNFNTIASSNKKNHKNGIGNILNKIKFHK